MRYTTLLIAALSVSCAPGSERQQTGLADPVTAPALQLGCPTEYEFPPDKPVPIKPTDGVGESRILARESSKVGDFSETPILATKTDSSFWTTGCDVFLGQTISGDDGVCRPREIFGPESKMSIHQPQRGSYELVVENVKRGEDPLKRQLVPVSAPVFGGSHDENSEKQIVWLKSEAPKAGDGKFFDRYDFYVYLQDVKESPPYKAYLIEAFDREDENCDKHLPGKTLCTGKPDEPRACKEAPKTLALGDRATKQTDTGGGHESLP